MELSGMERVMLLQLVPQQGSIRNARTIRDLREKLGFDGDAEKFGLKEAVLADGRTTLTWDPKLINQVSEFEIGEREMDIVADALKRLDAVEKLPVSAVTLWDKFIEM